MESAAIAVEGNAAPASGVYPERRRNVPTPPHARGDLRVFIGEPFSLVGATRMTHSNPR